MLSAIIPNPTGARVAAWTCATGPSCRGCYGHRDITQDIGSPEGVATEHARRKGMAEGRIHVVDSGRGHTFRVWTAAHRVMLREVL